jgi:hypothetical protein
LILFQSIGKQVCTLSTNTIVSEFKCSECLCKTISIMAEMKEERAMSLDFVLDHLQDYVLLDHQFEYN